MSKSLKQNVRTQKSWWQTNPTAKTIQPNFTRERHDENRQEKNPTLKPHQKKLDHQNNGNFSGCEKILRQVIPGQEIRREKC